VPITLILAAVLLGACASPPHAPSNLSTPACPLIAADLFPDRRQHKRYDAAQPDTPFIRRTLTPAPDTGAGPGLEVRSLTFNADSDPAVDTPVESRFLSLARATDGAILLVTSSEGGRTTHFDPPLIFMPASLEPGQQFEHSTTARVVGENGREQTSGRATRHVTYSGDAEAVDSGESGEAATASLLARPGPFRVVSARLDMDLFPARVVTTTTYWVNAAGIVREQQTTAVTVLGLPYQTRRHDVILVESSDAGSESTAPPVTEQRP